jgi:hypothetical protein
MSGHEVKVTLSADDKASSTLGKVEKSLAGVAHGHDVANAKAAAHGSSLWQNIKGTAVGTALGGAIGVGMHMGAEAMHKGVEEIKEIFHAGLGELEGRRTLAGVLTMTDQSGAGFDMMLDKGSLFKDQLEDLGVEAGVADDAIQSVFEGIAARSNKSAVEVAELTEKVVYAGRAVPGGAHALAAGFSQMEMGMIRARNPVVQLIAASHVLKGNAKDVAKQLQKMTPEKAMEMAEKAMENMGEKMKKAPATFSQLMTSMKGVKEQVAEAFGVPMVEELLPVLSQMKEFLVNNKDSIIQTAGTMVKKGAAMARETYDWGKTIWDTVNTSNLREMLTDGASAITKAFGVAATVTKTMWEAGAGIARGLGESYTGWKGMIKEAAELGMFGNFGKRKIEEGARDKDLSHGQETAGLAANPFFRKQAQKDLDDYAEHTRKIEALGGTVSPEDEAVYTKLKAQMAAAASVGEEAERVVAQHDEAQFGKMYKAAAAKHEEGTLFYMTKLLAGDEKLQDALIKGGFGLEGSFAEMAGRMAMAQGVDKAVAEKFAMKIKDSGTKSAHVTNFNGGQTFNIKQDFRDQDPDRIAVLFRQDVLKAANSRVQSSRAGAFSF